MVAPAPVCFINNDSKVSFGVASLCVQCARFTLLISACVDVDMQDMPLKA
ncbi:hypothetical protein ACFFYR_01990 [Paraburkholderia dipogonis]